MTDTKQLSDNFFELWGQVLKRALLEYKLGPSARDLQDYVFCTRENAEQWLKSDAETPGSFLWVCELLELTPSAVRREIFVEKGSRFGPKPG